MNDMTKVVSYLDRHKEILPTADGTQIKLEGKKNRVKKSKLDEWRIKGLEGGVKIKLEV